MPASIYQDIKHHKTLKRFMMLCTVSYTGIEASGVLYQTKVAYAKSDTMNEEENINFYNVFTEFYKFFVTVLKKYKDLAEKRIASLFIHDRYNDEHKSEMVKNNVGETEYKFLCFFSGDFDRVQKWCIEQKEPLGWSGNFMGYGLDLMILYLYSDNSLRKAIKKIVARISTRTGFNESKNSVFMKENSVFENQVSTQNGEEIIWDIFCLWKLNYEISMDDKNSYINWMEEFIGKRVDGIVGGKFRNKYEDGALLLAALGEVKESMGEKKAKSIVVNKYLNKYSRHTSFRGAYKAYID
jgi:hypothetical protein